jgi:hypothetical protein
MRKGRVAPSASPLPPSPSSDSEEEEEESSAHALALLLNNVTSSSTEDQLPSSSSLDSILAVLPSASPPYTLNADESTPFDLIGSRVTQYHLPSMH